MVTFYNKESNKIMKVFCLQAQTGPCTIKHFTDVIFALLCNRTLVVHSKSSLLKCQVFWSRFEDVRFKWREKAKMIRAIKNGSSFYF